MGKVLCNERLENTQKMVMNRVEYMIEKIMRKRSVIGEIVRTASVL